MNIVLKGQNVTCLMLISFRAVVSQW